WVHGSDVALLGHYAWFGGNAGGTMHPVATRMPNGFGLFDVHGNAWQWCQEVYGEKDNKDTEDITNKDGRVLRGGSFVADAGGARAAFRLRGVPADRPNGVGFRVARTYP